VRCDEAFGRLVGWGMRRLQGKENSRAVNVRPDEKGLKDAKGL